MQPRLRAIDIQQIWQRNQPLLVLHDRLGLCDRAVVLPMALAPLLALMDGTRDLPTLRVAFELRAGLGLPITTLEQLVQKMDETLLLDSPRFREAYQRALAEYRAAPHRPPALAGPSYAADGDALQREFEGYSQRADEIGARANPKSTAPRGVVIPHIDYQRGGTVYAQVWQRAAAALEEAEVVVVFGTDHNDPGPNVTLTRQSYATPWGVVPTDRAIVDAVVEAVGPEAAFANELNHRHEHSIELAVNWIHFLKREPDYKIVPVLCGSFQPFTDQPADPMDNETIRSTIETLRRATADRRTFVVAAADLAHVGPAFGDPLPYGLAEKAALARADEQMLRAVCSGQQREFLASIREERDSRRVCGLPPIYLAMELLGPTQGEVTSYAQCPADAEGGSLVSVAGVIFTGQQAT